MIITRFIGSTGAAQLFCLAAPDLINLEGIEGLATRVQVRLRSMGGRGGRAAQCSLSGASPFRGERRYFKEGGHLQFELLALFPFK
jgi:hypothetical protein